MLQSPDSFDVNTSADSHTKRHANDLNTKPSYTYNSGKQITSLYQPLKCLWMPVTLSQHEGMPRKSCVFFSTSRNGSFTAWTVKHCRYKNAMRQSSKAVNPIFSNMPHLMSKPLLGLQFRFLVGMTMVITSISCDITLMTLGRDSISTCTWSFQVMSSYGNTT